MTMATVPKGTVQGKTWSYTDESMMGGKKVKSRVTINEVSPTEYTFKMEIFGPSVAHLSLGTASVERWT